MIQLNNILSGEIAKILSANSTGVAYQIFENTIVQNGTTYTSTAQIDTKLVPNIAMCSDDLNEYLQLILLQSILPSFELSEDLQNWHPAVGSTGQLTLFRVFIPNEVHKKAMENRQNIESKYYYLYEIIRFCEDNLPIDTQKCTANYFVQYLEYIFPEHLEILRMFAEEGLIIESKVIETIEINIV